MTSLILIRQPSTAANSNSKKEEAQQREALLQQSQPVNPPQPNHWKYPLSQPDQSRRPDTPVHYHMPRAIKANRDRINNKHVKNSVSIWWSLEYIIDNIEIRQSAKADI